MIIRVTKNLETKLKILPGSSLPMASNPLLDWSLLDFKIGRQSFLLVANTPSLFATVIPVTGVNIRTAWPDLLYEYLEKLFNGAGRGSCFRKYVSHEIENPVFSKSLNRSILSSLNQIVYTVKVYFDTGLDDLDVITEHLNDNLWSAIAKPGEHYAHPKDAFAALMPPKNT